jgi:hypothetical protein
MESNLTSLPKQDKFAFVSIHTNQKNIIKANIPSWPALKIGLAAIRRRDETLHISLLAVSGCSPTFSRENSKGS